MPRIGPRLRARGLPTILAGGRSRRFGTAKALATLGGARMIERVIGAVGAVGRPVLITNEPAVYAELRLEARRDLLPGAGALSGIHTALHWAAELGDAGALCVACDLPFIETSLLLRLLELAERTGAAAVVPESEGPLGVEPLCAWYGIAAIPEAEERIAAGAHSVAGLLDGLRAERLPLQAVRAYGDPGIMFLNVNTPEEYERARRLAGSRGGGPRAV